MDCGPCEPFAGAIRRQFAYLFERHGFRQVQCDFGKGGEYCLVGLESAQARLKFELEQATPVLYLGTLDSPFDWANDVNGVPVWYVVYPALAFVEQQNPPPPLPELNDSSTTDDLLHYLAVRLQPQVEALEAAFAPDRPAEWWQAFNAFRGAGVR